MSVKRDTRFALIVERNADSCDNDLYNGHMCENRAMFAMIDTTETSDPEYPEGFHNAHFCATHAALRLLSMSEV